MASGKLSASIRLRLKSDIEQRTQQILGRIRELEGAIKKGGAEGEQAARKQSVEFKRLARAVKETQTTERQLAQTAHLLGAEETKVAGATRRATGALNAQSVALSKTTTAAKKTTGGLQLVSKATQNSGREMGAMVNVAAESAYSMGTAIPAFRNMGTQMAMMGGSAYQMGAALGPLGVGLAVVIGLIPTLISLFGDSASETDDATAATERNNRAHRTTLDLIDEEVQKQQRRQRQYELAQGARDVQEQHAAINVAIRQRTAERRRIGMAKLQRMLGDSFAGVSDTRRGNLIQAMQSHSGTIGFADLRAAGLNEGQARSGILRQQQMRSHSGDAQRASDAARIARADQELAQARAASRVAEARQAATEQQQQLEDQQRRLRQAEQRRIASLPPRQRRRASQLQRSGRLFSSARNVNRTFGVQAGEADQTHYLLQQVTQQINTQKDSELAPLLRDVAASNARVAAAIEADRHINVTVDPAAPSGAVTPDHASRLGGAE